MNTSWYLENFYLRVLEKIKSHYTQSEAFPENLTFYEAI